MKHLLLIMAASIAVILLHDAAFGPVNDSERFIQEHAGLLDSHRSLVPEDLLESNLACFLPLPLAPTNSNAHARTMRQ
jgi:hypothetical protein